MNARHEPPIETIDGEFQYPIYSPKGSIEGALLRIGGDPVQLVFEPHGGAGATVCASLRGGETVSVNVRAESPSDKGEGAHRVFRYEGFVAVDGHKLAKPAHALRAPFSGTVVRLNFARHGEPNGVVLDSGHFIHVRPEGMTKLRLDVGDRVEAAGDSRPLAGGGGQVVEAISVNGKAVGTAKPKRG